HEPRDRAGRLSPDGAEPRGHVRPRCHPGGAHRRLRARRRDARYLGPDRGAEFRDLAGQGRSAVAAPGGAQAETRRVTLSDAGFLEIGTQQLEYRMIGPRPDVAATLVLLHEGLGCVGLWGDFPERLAAATGVGVFAYSRAGFGRSSAVSLPRPLSFMPDEAGDGLPPCLEATGFRPG